MGIVMGFGEMGFVVCVGQFGENKNCNGLWGMGFVVLVRRCGGNENYGHNFVLTSEANL
jgi:hypothetical protein